MKRFLKSLFEGLKAGHKSPAGERRRACLNVECLEDRAVPTASAMLTTITELQAVKLINDVGHVATPQNTNVAQQVQVLAIKTFVDSANNQSAAVLQDVATICSVLQTQSKQAPNSALLTDANVRSDAGYLLADAVLMNYDTQSQGVNTGSVGFNANGDATLNGVTITPANAWKMVGLPNPIA